MIWFGKIRVQTSLKCGRKPIPIDSVQYIWEMLHVWDYKFREKKPLQCDRKNEFLSIPIDTGRCTYQIPYVFSYKFWSRSTSSKRRIFIFLYVLKMSSCSTYVLMCSGLSELGMSLWIVIICLKLIRYRK